MCKSSWTQVTPRWLCVTVPLLLAWGAQVQAQSPAPAQIPLLSKAGAVVKPNVMLTMDDSGSMQFQHMPETRFAGGTYTITNPVGSDQVRWDPNDNYQTGYLRGTVPGILSSTNYVLRALRAADTNTIFYNPEIRYRPWLTSDGVTRLPDSPPATAYRNPLVRTGAAGTFIDLTTAVNVTLPTVTKTYSGPILTRNIDNGTTYKILTVGSTDFRTCGSSNNTVGTEFTATRNGRTSGNCSGSGTVAEVFSTTTGSWGDWCYANAANYGTPSGNGCEHFVANFTHDPGVYFRLKKNASSVYLAVDNAANYDAFSINAAVGTTYTKYPARTDCTGTSCTRADERQNFANWFSYYRSRNLLARGAMMEAFGASTDTFRMGFGRINKGSATVDGVATTVLESSSTYNGGGVRDFTSSRKADLYKWLEDLPANGGTPLVKAMQAVGEYFSRETTQGPWTDNPAVSSNVVANNKTCRRSYQIMLTDGYWNGTLSTAVGNQDATDGTTITGVGATYKYVATNPYQDATSNTLADTAMKYWKTDLQPSTANAVPPVADNTSFWQNLSNYTVGLGVRGTLNPAVDLPALTAGTKVWPAAVDGNLTGANIDDLWHAALNSRGKYFSAKDPQELSVAVRTALAGATGGAGATAGVATASTVLSSSNRKYVPTFTAGSWNGDIAANPLDATGQVTAAVWKAAERLPAWNARNIVTWDSGLGAPAAVNFDWASLSTGNQAALGSVAATYTTKFIDFLKGDHSEEGTGHPFRTRLDSSGNPFILGDFINGNPVLVQSNFNGLYDNAAWGGATAYQAFLTAKAARTAVLFAGGNDGMLHAFRDTKAATGASALTDGQEIFAYVPRAVYANLEKLADKNYGTTVGLPHQYFVDGPLREADAYVKAPGASTASWRNYLMGSLGAGGRAVFALDVTDTANLGPNTVRWELSDSDDADIGYVLTPIKVAVLPNGRWVALFGNGYSSTNGYAALFIVDIELAANAATRASAIKKIVLDTTGGSGLGGVTVVSDAIGQVSAIFTGDLKGNFWRLNYDSSSSSYFTVAGGTALFKATDSGGTAQPIVSSPSVYNHSQGGYMIVLGTGKLFTDADAIDTSVQSVYGIWDKPSDTMTRPLTRANLATRTLSAFTGTGGAAGTTFYSLNGTSVNYTTQRGWLLDLAASLPGGRVLYPTQVVGNSTALISSVAPVQGTPLACESANGTGLNLILPVESGENPVTRTFDTNGDGAANGSDVLGVAYKTAADGIDAIVRSKQTNDPDGKGGIDVGGDEGDCTGNKCQEGNKNCEPSPLCPDEEIGGVVHKKCLNSIQSATMGMPMCGDLGPVGVTGTSKQYDRVWRRIINPPIR